MDLILSVASTMIDNLSVIIMATLLWQTANEKIKHDNFTWEQKQWTAVKMIRHHDNDKEAVAILHAIE